MTVIVWDGKQLVADRQATCSGMATTTRKIMRHKGMLIAACGDGPLAIAMMNWFRNGADPAKFPKEAFDVEGMQCTMWVINHDKTIHRYESSPWPSLHLDPTFADGSGRDYATAGLHLGLDAVKAAELACHFDIYCGRGLDVLELEPCAA